MLLPDWIAVCSTIVGICLLILGVRRWAVALLTPAVFRWVVWPAILPYLSQEIQRNSFNMSLAVVLFPLVLIFGGIWLLGRVVSAVYGRKTGANVMSEYLVRSIDGIARMLLWLVTSPFRMVRAIIRLVQR